VVFCAANLFAQLPSSACDLVRSPISECTILTSGTPPTRTPSPAQTESNGIPSPVILIAAEDDVSASAEDPGVPFVSATTPARPEGFHWGRALFESFVFLAIEQAYVVHDDYRWVVSENGVPFNHYWRDYKQSLHTWVNAPWDDGDNPLYSYVGHPIQGALTMYIQIQNDPQGANLEISNTKAYWRSRSKAFLWNAVYSTLWNIGPLSELTVEKYGTKDRPPWNQDGTWPCSKPPCVTGVGQVDLVMTPIGGTGWLLGEELLDKEIVRRVEGVTQNHFLIDVTRCALNPIRGGANILHGKRPWYRSSRDAREVYFQHQSKKQSSADAISRAPDSR
jgi:hypothetical protein